MIRKIRKLIGQKPRRKLNEKKKLKEETKINKQLEKRIGRFYGANWMVMSKITLIKERQVIEIMLYNKDNRFALYKIDKNGVGLYETNMSNDIPKMIQEVVFYYFFK